MRCRGLEVRPLASSPIPSGPMISRHRGLWAPRSAPCRSRRRQRGVGVGGPGQIGEAVDVVVRRRTRCPETARLKPSGASNEQNRHWLNSRVSGSAPAMNTASNGTTRFNAQQQPATHDAEDPHPPSSRHGSRPAPPRSDCEPAIAGRLRPSQQLGMVTGTLARPES